MSNYDNNGFNKNYDNGFGSEFGNQGTQSSHYNGAAINWNDTSVMSKVMASAFLSAGVGILISVITAVITALNINAMYTVYTMFAPLAIVEIVLVLAASFAISKRNVVVSGICYIGYALINGATLSFIFYAYNLGSIVAIFAVTVFMFFAMAAFAMFTKIDFTGFAPYLSIGLFAIIIVSMINIFVGNTFVDMLISIVAVVLFIGITIFDIQKIMNYSVGLEPTAKNLAMIGIMGGMEIYLDFINIFLRLLRLFAKER